MVLNKIDLADPEMVAHLAEEYQAVPVCALRQDTFADFLNRARDLVVGRMTR